MTIERTVAIVKPDGERLGYTGAIRILYTAQGLVVIRKAWFTFSKYQAETFYAEHKGKPFFPKLVEAMTEGPCTGFVLEGEDAIETVRKMNGATDPAKAEKGTIRNMFKSAGGPYNTVHGSANKADYERELPIAFNLPAS